MLATAPAPDTLLEEASAIARRIRLDVDREAYTAAGRDPRTPILHAGNRRARVCVLGRDLGRHEVRHAQPLVGPSGRAVRAAILTACGEEPSPRDPLLERALRHALVANVVPYKPRDNRPFPRAVREAFRPCIERLLVCFFRGEWVLALGNEACDWFAPYWSGMAPPARGCERFGAELACRVSARRGTRLVTRELVVCPLPHPSPANARYRAQFTALVAEKLAMCL